MIYITGDTHRVFNNRFSTYAFPEQLEMTKDDYVIICGDFGGVWYNINSTKIKSDDYWLDWLESKPFTTLFIDGNHENFDRLNKYPVKEWNGGKVHEIRPSVLHLMRGEIFCIDGAKIFSFGGAQSHDIDDGIIQMDSEGKWKKIAKQWELEYRKFRVKGLSWWEQELPNKEEMQNGLDNLAKHNNKVDFIITHSPSASMLDLLGHGVYKQDRLTKYLEDIRANTEYKKWFCGHMHDNVNINSQDILIYEQIVRIW